MDEKILKELYETFQLKERKGQGGMTFKYVPNEDVINRMNKVFEGNWCTRIIDKDIVDDQVVVEVQVDVHDAEGKCYTHTGFGSQQIMRYTQGQNAGKIIDIGNAYKGALAKGIVNACTRWGVGLFKERNPYELDNVTIVADAGTPPGVAPVRPPSNPAPKPAPAPVAPAAQPAPVQAPPAPSSAIPVSEVPQHTMTPSNVSPAPAAAPAPVVPPAAAAPAPQPAPAPVVESTTHNPAPPVMPEQPMATSVSLVQEEVPPEPAAPATPPTAPPGAPPMPSFPAPAAAPAEAAAPETPELPMSQPAAAPSNDINEVGISDVQRVALNGILTMHSANYDELAREAFDSKGMAQAVPPKENLSYQEAVVVIKYGNDKFKKNR